ncbi:MAG: SDR family oxidoreductase [Deltaproteobacteria bacterium]|jgi:NAD(P)-dependent dehydrogenase (short-subunit alcohol dehydrogenase family)|nr:SDR family oxidoreductase [Deltaproteobacteria bacterium]MBW2503101.1 SDR family oxidoreductase [Deltaproteobacteria bacterium]MBW2520201.1 SDR family oxidoreductase [Deltaproteobacteria bacterium]
MTNAKIQKVALVVGAGDHLGAAIAKRFGRENFHIVVTRRRGDMTTLIEEIEALGSRADGFHSDARCEDQVTELIEKIETEIGPIDVAVFNVGGNVRFGILETSSRVYRKTWEMCAFAGFLVGREVARRMLPRKNGTILFTGASASLRGAKGFAAFSGGKHALRALAQSMARELGPQGIHVGHVVIDGLIENPSTKKMFPDLVASKPKDGIIQPDHLGEIYWQLYQQPRSAWTFEIDARPYSEPW